MSKDATIEAAEAPLTGGGAIPTPSHAGKLIGALGRPPNRIDVLTQPGGVDWETAWSNRTESDYEGVAIALISISDLIRMKQHAGRPQDLVDVGKLQRILRPS